MPAVRTGAYSHGRLRRKSRSTRSKSKSVIGFQDHIEIVNYSGPEKPPVKPESRFPSDEDVRNPVTYKSQVDLKKIDFDLYDTTQLILGPTSNAPNYSYFTSRIEKVYIYMLLVAMFTAYLVAILLYTHFILPNFTYAKDVLVDFFAATKLPVLCHSSIPPILLLLVTLFNVAVVQYHKANSWKKFAPVRWVIFIGVEVYLLLIAIYFSTQLADFAPRIETTMRRDFDFKYKYAKKNDPSISNVYRWIQGSRMDHVQIYYQCCGIDTWKDWAPVLKHWNAVLAEHPEKYIHGYLCSMRYTEDIPWNMSEFAKNKKICKVPHTCWKKGKICSGVTDKSDNVITYTGVVAIWEDSCLYAEVALAYSVASQYIFFLLALIVFSSFVFWKTRKLILVANKMRVDLYTRPQFEECL